MSTAGALLALSVTLGILADARTRRGHHGRFEAFLLALALLTWLAAAARILGSAA